MAFGYDVGTYTLVCCQRDKENNFKTKKEINAFLEINLDDDFIFNMMKNAGVPLIKRGNVAYALGEAAVKMAFTMTDIPLKRPMKDGCVNPHERDAFEIMNIMIHGLLDEIDQDNALLYYSVPANAINEETDADYHGKILESIFRAYKSEKGYSVEARPINEALALIYAELASKAFTGIGISNGSGMVNVCFAVFGAPVFSFSLVNSGDWIDKQAARACNESITFINKQKEKINLNKDPETLVERAIQTQYRLMIEKTVAGIKKGMEENSDKKARLDHPIDMIIAGGTSLPEGFDDLFREVVKQANLPMEIGEVIRPDDALYSVSRGCLIAAENASK